MTVVHDHRRSALAAAAVTWSARALVAVVAGYLLLLGWLGGEPSFLWPGGLLTAAAAASFRWPDVAPLSVMLLLAFGLVALSVTWLKYGTESVGVDLIESDIESDLRDQTGVPVDVTCPDIVERVDDSTGGMFSCELVRPDGTTDRVTVSLQGDGGMRWWRIG